MKMTEYRAFYRLCVFFVCASLYLTSYCYIETTMLSNVTRKEELIKESEKTVENSCIPTKKLIFAKTHKTGSTTLQNIIFRFGEKNKLMFVLPKYDSHRFNLESHFEIQMAELFTENENVV